MSQPLGECPVCHKPLTDADDVVTCPSCGAPYHRACYQAAGRCAFEDKHGAGFEYKVPGAQSSASDSGPSAGPSPAGKTEGGVLCPACRTVNDAANIFCENCGAPLHGAAAGGGLSAGAGQAPPNLGGAPYGYAGQAAAMDLSGEIDGIPKGDWATFIGPNAQTYLARLAQQVQRGAKSAFVFSAFFFSSLYFAYRKMWKWAAAALAAFLILEIPSVLMMLVDIGYAPVAALPYDTLYTLAVVASYLDIARKLLFGVFALYLYRTDSGGKIKALREERLPEADYRQALAKKGGVSVAGAVIVGAIILVLVFLLYYIAWDEWMAYAQQLMSQGGLFSNFY